LLNLFFFFIKAGYQYQFWLIGTNCPGNPTYSYSADGNCGIASGSNSYVKVTYEIGTGDYDVYEYSDQQCTQQTNNFQISNNELNTCIAYLFSSYKFQIFFVCFPGESEVLTSDNQRVQLSDLKVGQSIATYGGSNSTFSEVYTFLDYQKDIYLDFLELHYFEEDGKEGKMALSHEHLILAKRTGDAKFVQAKDVKVGDFIFKNIQGSITPVIVSSITIGKYKGAFAPATLDGTVIVNDIVVSSYAVISHSVAHAFMAPLRLAYYISPSLFSGEINGMHPYAKFLYDRLSNLVQQPYHIYSAHTLDS